MTKARIRLMDRPEVASVKLFEVSNTANNRLLVLASDSYTALSIALSANHIHDIGPAKSDSLARRAEEVKAPRSRQLIDHWEVIQIAISERKQGTVHLEGGRVSVGYEAITR